MKKNLLKGAFWNIIPVLFLLAISITSCKQAKEKKVVGSPHMSLSKSAMTEWSTKYSSISYLSFITVYDPRMETPTYDVYVRAYMTGIAGNTLIVPSNLSDLSTLVASAMTIVSGARQHELPPPGTTAPKQA